MNFLSLTFLVFFSVTLLLYYLLPKKVQNALLLAANCAFYLWAGPAAGAYLLAAVLVSWLCALAMERRKRRRLWLALGVASLLGALFLLKYLDPAARALLALLDRGELSPFERFLPLGVSFYSFSLAGYLFDVYRGKCGAERSFLRFTAYAAFFPSVLSGPINRARELLPQLERPRRFDLEGFKAGLWRFLCGAGKKLVLANILAELIDPAYASPADFGSGTWLVVVCAGPLYLYADFSAYCDLALGAARMLGLALPENFRAPFLARTCRELWDRWQITLTGWLREYLIDPLGGEEKGTVRRGLLLVLACTAGGLWYGAGASFLVLGLLSGLCLTVGQWTLPLRVRLRERLRIPEHAWFVEAFQVLFTFALFAAGCVLLLAPSLDQASFIFRRILLVFRGGPGELAVLPLRKGAVLLACLLLTSLGGILAETGKTPRLERTSFRFWLSAAVLAAATLIFGQYGPDAPIDFLYFHI